MNKELIIDGMLSGTGIRDAVSGGYIRASEIGLSRELSEKILKWLNEYENEHYFQFENSTAIEKLDCEGIEIAKQLMSELPNILVKYYSNAKMKRIDFD